MVTLRRSSSAPPCTPTPAGGPFASQLATMLSRMSKAPNVMAQPPCAGTPVAGVIPPLGAATVLLERTLWLSIVRPAIAKTPPPNAFGAGGGSALVPVVVALQ